MVRTSDAATRTRLITLASAIILLEGCAPRPDAMPVHASIALAPSGPPATLDGATRVPVPADDVPVPPDTAAAFQSALDTTFAA